MADRHADQPEEFELPEETAHGAPPEPPRGNRPAQGARVVTPGELVREALGGSEFLGLTGDGEELLGLAQELAGHGSAEAVDEDSGDEYLGEEGHGEEEAVEVSFDESAEAEEYEPAYAYEEGPEPAFADEVVEDDGHAPAYAQGDEGIYGEGEEYEESEEYETQEETLEVRMEEEHEFSGEDEEQDTWEEQELYASEEAEFVDEEGEETESFEEHGEPAYAAAVAHAMRGDGEDDEPLELADRPRGDLDSFASSFGEDMDDQEILPVHRPRRRGLLLVSAAGAALFAGLAVVLPPRLGITLPSVTVPWQMPFEVPFDVPFVSQAPVARPEAPRVSPQTPPRTSPQTPASTAGETGARTEIAQEARGALPQELALVGLPVRPERPLFAGLLVQTVELSGAALAALTPRFAPQSAVAQGSEPSQPFEAADESEGADGLEPRFEETVAIQMEEPAVAVPPAPTEEVETVAQGQVEGEAPSADALVFGPVGPDRPEGYQPSAGTTSGSGTRQRVETVVPITAQVSVPDLPERMRGASEAEAQRIWTGEDVPMDRISGSLQVFTPRVGRVRVLTGQGEVFDGQLHSVGEGQVWLETHLGRLALPGAIVQRIERLPDTAQPTSRGVEAAAGDRVRVRTAGGVLTGRLVARDGDTVTILTESGGRVTLRGAEVEPAERRVGGARLNTENLRRD